MVHVLGPKDRKKIQALKETGVTLVNTTSRSPWMWSRELSPFFIGPVPLYGGNEARRMENGWQYSNVYQCHLDENGDPLPAYFDWAQRGWKTDKAHRYPMGKGAVPEYSWWDGEKLEYIEARKRIYIPLYLHGVLGSEAYQKLKEKHQQEGNVYLWDFDGYDYLKLGMSLEEVLNHPGRKMGHAFVLAMALTLSKQEILAMINPPNEQGVVDHDLFG